MGWEHGAQQERDDARREEHAEIASLERDRAVVAALITAASGAAGMLKGAADAMQDLKLPGSAQMLELASGALTRHIEAAAPILRRWGLYK